MAVHDEILALCSELHRTGIDLTYDTIRNARGRGSRRDIAAALREWHRRRAQEVASAALVMPDHITAMGNNMISALWAAMEHEFAEMRREASVDIDLIELHASKEIDHLHQIIGDQHSELEQLRAEVGLHAKLKK